jgi:hypothetical protein
MIFTVTMQTPDALERATQETAEASADTEGMEFFEKEQEINAVAEELRKSCEKWFKYGEVLTVEIDLSEGTCKVLEN